MVNNVLLYSYSCFKLVRYKLIEGVEGGGGNVKLYIAR